MPIIDIDSNLRSEENPYVVHFDNNSYTELLSVAGLNDEQISQHRVVVEKGDAPQYDSTYIHRGSFDYFDKTILISTEPYWSDFQMYAGWTNPQEHGEYRTNVLQRINEDLNDNLLHETGHSVDFTNRISVVTGLLINLSFVTAAFAKTPLEMAKELPYLRLTRQSGFKPSVYELTRLSKASFVRSFFSIHDFSPFERRADNFVARHKNQNNWGNLIRIEPKA